MQLTERFLNYVRIHTESDPNSSTIPSTMRQKDLGRVLVDEMKTMGIADAELDENGYVMGTIPATLGCEDAPVIGFIAHMDTSPDLSGEHVKARIVENYQGGDIVLNEEKGIVLRTAEFDSLQKYVGKDLIVTDGTTLLGGDDKAGIAEIMTMAERLLADPSKKHGTIKLGFTPDEEIGRGPLAFSVEKFGADFAYTVDGGELGELVYENFNACQAVVTITGTNIHPGSAKGKMKNSIYIGMEFSQMLPAIERPEHTEGYEGFSHLQEFSGSVEHTKLLYIIRDHDLAKFGAKKARFEKIAAYLNEKYGEGTVTLTLTDSYFNMIEQIKPHMHLIEVAQEAMRKQGVEPFIEPARGGTDGAQLSFKGLPCPNLCTGGHNAHGRYEYTCIQSMEKIADVLETIALLYGEKKRGELN